MGTSPVWFHVHEKKCSHINWPKHGTLSVSLARTQHVFHVLSASIRNGILFCFNRDGCYIWCRKCSFHPDHMFSLPLGVHEFTVIIYIYIYILRNLSVSVLCLRINYSDLFAWINLTVWSRNYCIVVAPRHNTDQIHQPYITIIRIKVICLKRLQCRIPIEPMVVDLMWNGTWTSSMSDQ